VRISIEIFHLTATISRPRMMTRSTYPIVFPSGSFLSPKKLSWLEFDADRLAGKRLCGPLLLPESISHPAILRSTSSGTEIERERRAGIDFGLCPDIAIMPPDNPLSHGEADSGSLEILDGVQALENAE
jgi:hypothetical protein